MHGKHANLFIPHVISVHVCVREAQRKRTKGEWRRGVKEMIHCCSHIILSLSLYIARYRLQRATIRFNKFCRRATEHAHTTSAFGENGRRRGEREREACCAQWNAVILRDERLFSYGCDVMKRENHKYVHFYCNHIGWFQPFVHGCGCVLTEPARISTRRFFCPSTSTHRFVRQSIS